MGRKHYRQEFKREGVQLVEVRGRYIPETGADLGVGRATLNRWFKEFRDQNSLSGPHEDASKETARLRNENDLLRQERGLLKCTKLTNSPVNCLFDVMWQRSSPGKQ